ncbi:HAD family hydrolase [Lysinibacillus piscis]|uniref:HAD family hydrolase n=1 Tax=Lysinibacillus piscis TaxID=2518931 RepID=A0ABQ5NP43_9BACI|nr:HAD family hydrolase [Lysinibacillus sp. KH24]GLC90099.1 hypothetical protein LYSBPC_32260 [Lysinibacillus sp. KH24]
MIKGIIFDFDGLILDTETYQYELYKQLFEQHQVELPFTQWLSCIGTKSNFSLIHYLIEHSEATLHEETLRNEFTHRLHTGLKSLVARAGVSDYLQEAKVLGLKVGLASSSDRQWVHGHLENLGLLHFFDCIKTADDVVQVKPAPDLYLQASAGLGLEPTDCLAFEDSVNGLQAAKAAGLLCVVVPNFLTSHMTFTGMDGQLKSMTDMPLHAIIQQVTNK